MVFPEPVSVVLYDKYQYRVTYILLVLSLKSHISRRSRSASPTLTCSSRRNGNRNGQVRCPTKGNCYLVLHHYGRCNLILKTRSSRKVDNTGSRRHTHSNSHTVSSHYHNNCCFALVTRQAVWKTCTSHCGNQHCRKCLIKSSLLRVTQSTVVRYNE